MADYKVEITGLNTGNLKRLSDSKMTELFNKLSENKEDKITKDKLVLGNLKLVLSILKKYKNRGENLDDLFQIGCICLVKAIDNFDLSFGVKFSTYSVLTIDGEIRKYLRDNSTIRVSRSVKDNAYKILSFKNDYIMEKGVEPSLDLISEKLNLSKEDIVFALEATKNTVSYFEPIYDDGGETIYLFDQLTNNEDSNEIIDSITLKDTIKKLKDKEKEVLIERYFMGKTQVELSEEYNISQAQISRIEKNALNNIKKLLR